MCQWIIKILSSSCCWEGYKGENVCMEQMNKTPFHVLVIWCLPPAGNQDVLLTGRKPLECVISMTSLIRLLLQGVKVEPSFSSLPLMARLRAKSRTMMKRKGARMSPRRKLARISHRSERNGMLCLCHIPVSVRQLQLSLSSRTPYHLLQGLWWASKVLCSHQGRGLPASQTLFPSFTSQNFSQ